MGINLDKLRESLENMTQEEKDHYFPKDTKPKGWVDVNEHLPMMKAMDMMVGWSEYKVRYWDGIEGTTRVSDHNTWKHFAEIEGITHWWNE